MDQTTRLKISAFRLGLKHSEDTKFKIGLRTKGKTYEEMYGTEKAGQIKQKIGLSKKGKTYEEIYGPERAKTEALKRSCALKGKKLSPEHREKCRLNSLGKKPSQKTKEKMSRSNTGKHNRPHTEEEKRLMSAIKQGISLSEWNGYKEPLNMRIRKSRDYTKWRDMVFQRDGYTCQYCRKKGCNLNAHHLKQFALFPELILNPNNGITLCEDCHNKTEHTSWCSKKVEVKE